MPQINKNILIKAAYDTIKIIISRLLSTKLIIINMKKNYILSSLLIASLLMFCNIFVNAQSITLPFQSNFSAVGGNSTTSGGSGTLLTEANFPTGFSFTGSKKIYGGGQKLKLGAGDSIGVLPTHLINTGSVTMIEVKFDAFAWPQTSGSPKSAKLILTYGTQVQEVIVTGKVGWPLENSELIEYSCQFNAIAAPTSLIIKTAPGTSSNEYRAFLNNIRIAGVSANAVAIPTITPAGGLYTTTQTVTIECATPGATILYTTDGATPTAASPPYSGSFQVSATTTVKAMGVKPGMDNSGIASATYTLPEPVANIAAFKATTTVTSPTIYKITGDVTFVYKTGRYIFIKDDSGGLVIYDNATPVITTAYNNGDIISGGVIGSCTVWNGLYQLIPSVNTPSGTPGATVLPKVVTMAELLANFDKYQSQLLLLESVTFDAGTFGTGAAANINIHQGGSDMICRNHFGNITDYVTDPSKPYHVAGFAIPYNADKEICPRSVDDIYLPGSVVEPPVFDPPGGNFTESIIVSISTATAGAGIYYTTDGSEPTQTSIPYSASFIISETTTVKARAFHTDFSPSMIVSATYKFPDPDKAATPFITPASGTYIDEISVNITCATPGAAIYYTLNGNVPTESDMLFENPIEIKEGTVVLKARAFATGLLPSDVATADYSIQVGIQEWQSLINIYPNPTNGQLTISFAELAPIGAAVDNGQLTIENVEIYDAFGRKVFDQKVTLTVLQSYDLTVLQAGVYFIKINTEKGEGVWKVIKN